MKLKFLIVAALCLTLVMANEGEEPVTDRQADCISDILRELEVDGEHVGDMGSDVRETARRLLDQRERCENMLDDPPTALQERMHEACRLAWTATVAYELNRLRGQSNSRDWIDDAISGVQECRAGNNTEE